MTGIRGLLALLAVACGNVQSTPDAPVSIPDAAPDDAIVIVDAGPLPDGSGLRLVTGAVGTLGERPAPPGTLRVVDDGLEPGGLLCNGTLCVRGGIAP
jgi:hypothetical protein